MQLKIAIGQIDIVLGDRAANLDAVRQLAARAELEGAGLLVLPELWGSGYDLERAEELSDAPGQGLFAETGAAGGDPPPGDLRIAAGATRWRRVQYRRAL
jgi:predicted amidohydrolase